MHLFAALVPPLDALERARTMAAGVAAVPERPGVEGSPRRHLAGSGRLFGRRRQPDATGPAQTGPPLDLLPAAQMHLVIAKFGNLPLGEATRLAEALDREALGWETPRLLLSGGVAREPEGDDSVWVKLAGDLDALSAVTRGVTRVAQGLQLFVDRRAFRPHVQLGTLSHRTTTSYLEELRAALETFESTAWWQTTVSLLTPADLGPDQPPFKTYRDIPLGRAVAH